MSSYSSPTLCGMHFTLGIRVRMNGSFSPSSAQARTTISGASFCLYFQRTLLFLCLMDFSCCRAYSAKAGSEYILRVRKEGPPRKSAANACRDNEGRWTREDKAKLLSWIPDLSQSLIAFLCNANPTAARGQSTLLLSLCVTKVPRTI